jgi:hypothetical protein
MTFRALALAIALIGALSAPSVLAQDQSLPTGKPIVLKPKLKLADIKGVLQFIGGVELRGTEVDAFLDTRKALVDVVESNTKNGKKDEDVITFDIRLDQANNLYQLMNRGTVKGAEAEKFKEITTALQEAAKAAQPK